MIMVIEDSFYNFITYNWTPARGDVSRKCVLAQRNNEKESKCFILHYYNITWHTSISKNISLKMLLKFLITFTFYCLYIDRPLVDSLY